jgi:hypothetical protein
MRFFFNSNNGISTKKLQQISQKYLNDVLVGIDPGDDRPSDVALPMFAECQRLTLPVHVYFVGPGMLSWSSQERNQIIRHAKSVGIDTSKKNWHAEWIDWGWKDKVVEQVKFYQQTYWDVFTSFEIDNLDSAIDNDPDKTVKYYYQLFKTIGSEDHPTLMLKNMSEDQLHAIIDARSELSAHLSRFAIFEKGTGNPRTQMRLCEMIGIQAITPINGLNDTWHYGVTDSGVKYECDPNNLLK